MPMITEPAARKAVEEEYNALRSAMHKLTAFRDEANADLSWNPRISADPSFRRPLLDNEIQAQGATQFTLSAVYLTRRETPEPAPPVVAASLKVKPELPSCRNHCTP